LECGEFFPGWSESLTVSTPWGVEFNDPESLSDGGVERVLGKINNVGGWFSWGSWGFRSFRSFRSGWRGVGLVLFEKVEEVFDASALGEGEALTIQPEQDSWVAVSSHSEAGR